MHQNDQIQRFLHFQNDFFYSTQLKHRVYRSNNNTVWHHSSPRLWWLGTNFFFLEKASSFFLEVFLHTVFLRLWKFFFHSNNALSSFSWREKWGELVGGSIIIFFCPCGHFCLYFGIQRMRRDLAYFVIKLLGFHPNALMINHRFCDLVHFIVLGHFRFLVTQLEVCVQLDL